MLPTGAQFAGGAFHPDHRGTVGPPTAPASRIGLLNPRSTRDGAPLLKPGAVYGAALLEPFGDGKVAHVGAFFDPGLFTTFGLPARLPADYLPGDPIPDDVDVARGDHVPLGHESLADRR